MISGLKMWKTELIEKHPEWEYYYKSFDLWLEAQEQMKLFDKISVRYF
jgi:hypothetical protein